MRTLYLTNSPHRFPDGSPVGRVVTPNRRAAASLGVAPVSLDGLSREILRGARLLVAGDLARQRTLREALRDTLAPDDLEGTLRRYTPTVREVLRAGLDGASDITSLSPRARAVIEVTRHYRARLAERGQIDPAEVLWAAADRVSEPVRLALVGYGRLGPGEAAFIDALADEGSLLLFGLDDDTAATELVGRGWTIERDPAPPTALGDRLAGRFFESAAGGVVVPEAEALHFDSQEAEVRHILTRVKQLLHDGVSHEQIVLIARDEPAYGPLLGAIGWEYDVPVVASYGVPLADTRFGAWIDLVAAVVRERAPFEASIRLLAHPLSGGIAPQSWQQARRDHPRGAAQWREIDARIATLDWPGSAERTLLVDRLFAALDLFGVTERVAPRSLDALAALRFGAAAQGLAAPSDASVTLGTFLAELGELLQLLTVPVGAGRVGVELHSPLAVYGAGYAHVFVLGVAEGVTPAPVRDDPLLDFFERTGLARSGLPLEGALERAGREASSFAAMLRCARQEIVLSYPRSLAGRSRIESAYFTRLGLVPVSPPTKPPASREEARSHLLQRADSEEDGLDYGLSDEVLAAARLAWRVERRRESESPPDHHDGVMGVPRDPDSWIFSASQLVGLGQCPFKWFAERLLRLAEPEEADDDIGPLLRGRLWHRAVESALRRAADSPDERAAVLEVLDDAFAEAERREGVPGTPTWPQRRVEHLQRLRHALRSTDFWPEGAEVVALEATFEAQWRGLRVAGVVDRIDRTAAGLRLVDYKTRASLPEGAKDGSGRARIDVQLPLYLEAAAPVLFPGEPVAEASYYSLSAARNLRRPRLDDKALDGLAERARRHLEQGSYPVDPDLFERACATCSFDLLCRRGPRLERKRLAREDADA